MDQILSQFQHPWSSKFIPLRSILMLSSHLVDFASRMIPRCFPQQNFAYIPCPPSQANRPSPAQSPEFQWHKNPWWLYRLNHWFLALTTVLRISSFWNSNICWDSEAGQQIYSGIPFQVRIACVCRPTCVYARVYVLVYMCMRKVHTVVTI